MSFRICKTERKLFLVVSPDTSPEERDLIVRRIVFSSKIKYNWTERERLDERNFYEVI